MDKNYKGLLQEYYQKQGLDLPIYTYTSCNGTSGWIAHLQTKHAQYNSAPCGSKKEADQAVAQMALEPLLNVKNKPSQQTTQTNLSTKQFTLVVVDLENYPQIDTPDFLNTQFTNVQFNGFVGKCSSHAQIDLPRKYPFMSVCIVNSVLPDAVDHYISMYIGQFIGMTAGLLQYGSQHNYNIIVLTRDRFVGCTIDAARQIEPELNIDIVHAVNAKECYDYLVQFSK